MNEFCCGFAYYFFSHHFFGLVLSGFGLLGPFLGLLGASGGQPGCSKPRSACFSVCFADCFVHAQLGAFGVVPTGVEERHEREVLVDAIYAIRVHRFFFFANFAHQVIIVGPDNFGHIFSFSLHFPFGQLKAQMRADALRVHYSLTSQLPVLQITSIAKTTIMGNHSVEKPLGGVHQDDFEEAGEPMDVAASDVIIDLEQRGYS